MPKDAKALDAWIAYHAGRFEDAVELGLAAGGSGINAANKAACIYGTYLEEDEKKKLKIFEDAAARAEQQQKSDPKNANAFYLHAFALGRYAQGISIVKALKLNPDSAIARIEMANGLIMLHGKSKVKEAEKLYAEAAKHKPVDAMERLDVEQARAELE